MKNHILFGLLLAGAFTLISCGDDDNADTSDNQTSADQTTEIAQTGTWRISSFIDSGEDETTDFNGYVFTFNTDGSLVAVNGTTTVSGTWSVTDDSSNSSTDDDGNSTDDDDFNIFFPVPESSDFEDLNDDWDVISVSPTVISLIDISGGNGGTDTLTFTQN
tara:strand:- start:129 stop:614 length:486 start_codon:yes stop_codon:yes gene_type:complete